MRTTPAALLLLLAACSDSGPAGTTGETDEYFQWKQSITFLPTGAVSNKLKGSVEFDLRGRAHATQDWVELYLNGDRVMRTFVHSPEGQAPRLVRADVVFINGPNWIKFWDTHTNRGYTFQVDTATLHGKSEMTDFLLTPGGEEGFTITQQ